MSRESDVRDAVASVIQAALGLAFWLWLVVPRFGGG
jgi:hypothetical protein